MAGKARNKVMRRFSKKTIGTTVDTVADYIDLFSQMVAEYFNQRYKIKKRVEDVKRATLNALYGLKREFIKTLVEALFLMTGLIALIVGVVLLLRRFFPLEYIFLAYGVLVTLFILFRMKLKV